MNKHLERAEQRLKADRDSIERLGQYVELYSRELDGAEGRERELRDRRDLDGLTAAVSRRIATTDMLAKVRAELESARAELNAAEAVATRERLLAEQIAIINQAIPVEAELKGKLGALETVVKDALADLMTTQEKVDALRGRYYAISPAATPGELKERGAQNPPAILRPFNPVDGEALPGHPLRATQKEATPNAWQVFYTAIANRFGIAWRKQRDEQERQRQARLAALRGGDKDKDPYKP